MALRHLGALLSLAAAVTGRVPAEESHALIPDPRTDSDCLVGTNFAHNAEKCCTTEDNQHHQKVVNFSNFGVQDSEGQWPGMWLLGVQKAATTSIAQTLIWCGVAAFGTNVDDNGSSACEETGKPCKETLHHTDPLSERSAMYHYVRQFSSKRCDNLNDDDKASRSACQHGQFIEATPLDTPPGTPEIANTVRWIPSEVLPRMRFVLSVREPISRLLSWYNFDQMEGYNQEIVNMSFTQLAQRLGPGWPGNQWQLSHPAAMIDAFRDAANRTGVDSGRHQLLVIACDAVISNPSDAMRRITVHYGLPRVISKVSVLPETNAQNSAGKLVSIKCTDRALLAGKFSETNEKLYAMLKADRELGLAPEMEPEFSRFDVTKVACGEQETRSTGRLVRRGRRRGRRYNIWRGRA